MLYSVGKMHDVVMLEYLWANCISPFWIIETNASAKGLILISRRKNNTEHDIDEWP